MQAIILAGGLGTRLRSIVSDVPKPLAPVADRPFITYLLDQLECQGFSSIILSVGYLSDAIVATLGDEYRGVKIRYSIERQPLGTGGALREALNQVDHFPVFALNGDTLVDVNYEAMLACHNERKAPLTIGVCELADTSRYGRVLVGDGHVIGFDSDGAPGPGLMNCGTYVFGSNLLANIGLPQQFSFERDFLANRLEQLRPASFVTSGYFIDIGVPQDYARAQSELPGRATAR